MTTLQQYHHLTHFSVSLIGGILLMAIYWSIHRRFRSVLNEDGTLERVDKGLLFLSLSLFIWAASGLWGYLETYGSISSTLDHIAVNTFSISNNAFILLSLLHFEKGPEFLRRKQKRVFFILGIALIAIILALLLPYLMGVNHTAIDIFALPDLALSGWVSYLLLKTLYSTFKDKSLHVIAVLSVFTVGFLFLSQLPETIIGGIPIFGQLLIKIITKVSLIFIFLLLATIWVIQLAEKPRIQEIELKFVDWSLIQLSIPSKGIDKTYIDFGGKTTQFKNLMRFAIRRKFGVGIEQSILVGSHGELKSQTYLTRIIENINTLLNNPIDVKLERFDLFTFLGEGRYRLRMLPEHISFQEDLHLELIETLDDKAYQKLIASYK